MEKYIGTKLIEAEPINRGDYNIFRGWQIPADENPADEGYLVKYADDYISWSPKKTFEEVYFKSGNLNFGAALHMLKMGYRIARKGWNGKGMYVYMVPANSYPANTPAAKEEFGDSLIPYEAYFAIRNVKGTINTWVPSVSDLLAEDWEVVE